MDPDLTLPEAPPITSSHDRDDECQPSSSSARSATATDVQPLPPNLVQPATHLLRPQRRQQRLHQRPATSSPPEPAAPSSPTPFEHNHNQRRPLSRDTLPPEPQPTDPAVSPVILVSPPIRIHLPTDPTTVRLHPRRCSTVFSGQIQLLATAAGKTHLHPASLPTCQP
ncbi:hypothetical protein ACLOJK_036709, partial [Asimina triloba]